ncbi:MAG: hypothetical protein ACMG6E_08980, partial [Candidatus Roizmanbacteria bacterium]
MSTCSIILFGSLKVTGLFRIEKEIEIIGLDAAEIGGIEPHILEKVRNHTFISRATSFLSSNSPINLPHGQKQTAAARFKDRQTANLGGSIAYPRGDINKSEDSEVGASMIGG